jgi:hypothetical protein
MNQLQIESGAALDQEELFHSMLTELLMRLRNQPQVVSGDAFDQEELVTFYSMPTKLQGALHLPLYALRAFR